ncbi:MAG: WbqC family protein [Curvibacter sp.]|nr:WbqC family protein [Curvibacter sp.]
MKLAIMQPYFFPYLGHFALIAAADEWLVFDVTQYTPKSWMSRNRVLHPKEGWNYVLVPLANGSISIRTQDARILGFDTLEQSILGKLSHYRRKAPYYNDTIGLVRSAFAEPLDNLVDLNIRTLELVCARLGIPFKWRQASRLDGVPADVAHAGAWAPMLSQAVGAQTYINPIGGASIFRQSDFDRAGVACEFLEFQPAVYPTPGYGFIENLSVIDVLMWNKPDSIRDMLARNTRLLPSRQVIAQAPPA